MRGVQPDAAALAIATALLGLCTFTWTPSDEGPFARLFSDLLAAQPWLRHGAYALAGATAVYAGSLALVSLPASWDRGQVLVAALWSAVAVSLIVAGRRLASLTALGASVALVLAYDVPEIAEVERSWAFGIVALAAIAVAVGLELRSRVKLELPAVVAAATSALLAAAARSSSTTTSGRVQRCWRSRSAMRRSVSRSCAAGATLHPCSACSRSGWPSRRRSSF